MIHVLRSLRGGTAVAFGMVLCIATQASADVLISLGTTNVATTYTFPQDGAGVLELNDSGLGLIATFDDQTQTTVDDVALTLSVDLLSELGDPNDSLAHGSFGGGLLTMVDTTNGSPGVTVFQAMLTDFELMEVVPGAFAGSGSFINATYGGDLAAVTMPTEGDILTSLFAWHTSDANGPVVDIDNFLTAPPGGSTIFADMENLNVLPEPSALMTLALLAVGVRRRRRVRCGVSRRS